MSCQTYIAIVRRRFMEALDIISHTIDPQLSPRVLPNKWIVPVANHDMFLLDYGMIMVIISESSFKIMGQIIEWTMVIPWVKYYSDYIKL